MSARISNYAWSAAQTTALAAAAVLVAGLWVAPDTALRFLWGGVIPALPAVYLMHPGLWRNVCPMASLNMAVARRGRRKRMSPRTTHAANAVGISLFAALVPLRGSLFEVNGHATAVVMLLFAALAVVGGGIFDRKAGFCNAICPLLPLERLYGQAPAVGLSNPRCASCTLCVKRGCIDIAPHKSIAQTLGRSRHTAAWVTTPFGAFAAAFPGFVLGFFLVPAGATPYLAYGMVGVGAAISWLMTAGIARAFEIPARRAMPVLATAALLSFYWFTGAKVADAWNGGVLLTWTVRGAAVAIVTVWHLQRVRRAPRRARARRRLAPPASGFPSIHGPRTTQPTPSAA
jgi:nitrite reductase (NADH) large subunit